MKKITKILMLFSVFMLSAVALVACGGNKISTMTLKNGTLETVIEKGKTLDTSNVVVYVTYEDDTQKEVSAENLSFGTIDTQTTGDKSLSIKYTDDNDQSKEIFVTIRVVATEADILSVSSLTSKLLADYSTNKINDASENIEYKDKEQPLYVGDDNAFNFRIVAGGFDGLDNFVGDIEKVRTNITVSLLQDGEYQQLQNDDIAYYVSIDTENTELDFTENAVGHTFKVDVCPSNIDASASLEDVSFSAELCVVDAYNVYTAKQLSVFHNEDNSYSQIWEELGLTYDDVKNIKGIILQDNIVITKDDVRQKTADGKDMFWTETTTNYDLAKDYTTEELLGTPVDNQSLGLYNRRIYSGDEFNFIGNYFTVDLSQFPKMVVENDGSNPDLAVKVDSDTVDAQYMTAHLCVFYTWASENSIKAETQVNWKNVAFTGNIELNNDPVNSGGILLMKNSRVNFNAYNTLINNFYIGYFTQLGLEVNDGVENEFIGNYVIEKSKGYNFYQCAFYGWGSKNVLFLDCEYKQAGGPAIIADHCLQQDNNPETGYPSHINLVDTVMESVITAQSPWFVIYGADALVAQIPLLNTIFNGEAGLPDTGKTIIPSTLVEDGQSYQQLNLVAVLKNGEQGLAASNIASTLNIFDTYDDYEKYYGLGDYTVADKSSNYGLDLSSNVANLARTNSANYVEDNATGAFMKGATENIKDGSMFKLSVMAQVLNGVIDGIIAEVSNSYPQYETVIPPMLTPLKIDLQEFAELTLDEKTQKLQETVTSFGNVATLVQSQMPSMNLMTYIPVGMQQAQIFEELSDYNNKSIQEQVAILNTEIATYKDIPVGDYINIYTLFGIGAVLRFYPREVA